MAKDKLQKLVNQIKKTYGVKDSGKAAGEKKQTGK